MAHVKPPNRVKTVRRRHMDLVEEHRILNGHYKRLMTAKSVVDNTTPRSFYTNPRRKAQGTENGATIRNTSPLSVKSRSRSVETLSRRLISRQSPHEDDHTATGITLSPTLASSRPFSSPFPRSNRFHKSSSIGHLTAPTIRIDGGASNSGKSLPQRNPVYERRLAPGDIADQHFHVFNQPTKPFQPRLLLFNVSQSKIAQNPRHYQPPVWKIRLQNLRAGKLGIQTDTAASSADGPGLQSPLRIDHDLELYSPGSREQSQSSPNVDVRLQRPKLAADFLHLSRAAATELLEPVKYSEEDSWRFMKQVTEDIISAQTCSERVLFRIFAQAVKRWRPKLPLSVMRHLLTRLVDDIQVPRNGILSVYLQQESAAAGPLAKDAATSTTNQENEEHGNDSKYDEDGYEEEDEDERSTSDRSVSFTEEDIERILKGDDLGNLLKKLDKKPRSNVDVENCSVSSKSRSGSASGTSTMSSQSASQKSNDKSKSISSKSQTESLPSEDHNDSISSKSHSKSIASSRQSPKVSTGSESNHAAQRLPLANEAVGSKDTVEDDDQLQKDDSIELDEETIDQVSELGSDDEHSEKMSQVVRKPMEKDQKEPATKQKMSVEDQEVPVKGQKGPVERQKAPVERQEEAAVRQEVPEKGQEEPMERQEVQGQHVSIGGRKPPMEGQKIPIEGQQRQVEWQKSTITGSHNEKSAGVLSSHSNVAVQSGLLPSAVTIPEGPDPCPDKGRSNPESARSGNGNIKESIPATADAGQTNQIGIPIQQDRSASPENGQRDESADFPASPEEVRRKRESFLRKIEKGENHNLVKADLLQDDHEAQDVLQVRSSRTSQRMNDEWNGQENGATFSPGTQPRSSISEVNQETSNLPGMSGVKNATNKSTSVQEESVTIQELQQSLPIRPKPKPRRSISRSSSGQGTVENYDNT